MLPSGPEQQTATSSIRALAPSTRRSPSGDNGLSFGRARFARSGAATADSVDSASSAARSRCSRADPKSIAFVLARLR